MDYKYKYEIARLNLKSRFMMIINLLASSLLGAKVWDSHNGHPSIKIATALLFIRIHLQADINRFGRNEVSSKV